MFLICLLLYYLVITTSYCSQDSLWQLYKAYSYEGMLVFLNYGCIFSQTCITTQSNRDGISYMYPYSMKWSQRKKNSMTNNANETSSLGFIFKSVVTVNYKRLPSSCTWLHNYHTIVLTSISWLFIVFTPVDSCWSRRSCWSKRLVTFILRLYLAFCTWWLTLILNSEVVWLVRSCDYIV